MFEPLYHCEEFDISPTSIKILEGILNGKCERLAQDFTTHREYLEVTLKSVICGTFVDKKLHFIKDDNSLVSLADLCVQVIIMEVLMLSPHTRNLKIIAEENLETFDVCTLEHVAQTLNAMFPLCLLYSLLGVETEEISAPSKCWTRQLICEHFHQITNRGSYDVKKLNHSVDAPPFCFILDPIDGTKGFVREAQFAVALGLLHMETNKALISVVSCPNLFHFISEYDKNYAKQLGTLYYAVAQQGAHVDLFSLSQPQILAIDETIPKELRFVTSAEQKHTHGNPIALFEDGWSAELPSQVFRLDSMAKYCLIANGWANIFLRHPKPDYHEYIWDVLPGALIVEESGGIVTHGDGSCVTYHLTKSGTTLENTSGLVITGHGGKAFHQRVLDTLNKNPKKVVMTSNKH